MWSKSNVQPLQEGVQTCTTTVEIRGVERQIPLGKRNQIDSHGWMGEAGAGRSNEEVEGIT